MKEKRKSAIAGLKKKLEKIEQAIITTSTVALQKKLEEERSQIQAELEVLEKELKEKVYSVDKTKDLLAKTKILFEDPLAIWKL